MWATRRLVHIDRTAIGALETIKDVGQALGPIVVGLISSMTTHSQAFLIAALIELAALGIAIIVFKMLKAHYKAPVGHVRGS